MAWEADDHAQSLHLAAREGDITLAVASVLLQGPEGETAGWWRVRGMATIADQRSRGLGGRLLEVLLAHVAEHGGGRVWCTVRTGAITFYARYGFEIVSEVFELPGIGPHVRMETEVLAG